MEKEHFPNYWAVLPAEVRYSKKISSLAKLLYAEITALSNKDGYCWASNSYFAELYGRTTTQISITIKSLEKAKFIKSEVNSEEGNLRRIYILPLPSLKKLKEGSLKKLKEGSLRKFKENNINKNIIIYNSNEDVIKMLRSSKQRHLNILGWFAKEKKIDFMNVYGKTEEEKQKNIKKRISSFIEIHGKYASKLACFTDKQILDAAWLAKWQAERGGYDWTLSTVLKKIDHLKEN